jgi:hypothetical protein
LLNKLGQPEIVRPADAQFEATREYLGWAARGLPGGVTELAVKDGRYVIYERKPA